MALVRPPDYLGELQRRAELEKRLSAEPHLVKGAKFGYALSPADLIGNCCYVVEPRNANSDEPVTIPVVLFPRQRNTSSG